MSKDELFSSITAFIIGLSVALTAAIVEAKGNLPGAGTWIVAVLGAAAVAAKDVRSLRKLPPVDGNNPKP